jgi:hypothetical protein
MQTSSLGNQQLAALASKYGVSLDAVQTLLAAVQRGNGSMAQFSHPELGGSGQWMQGGMVMVGDMFNQSLKYTVGNLCQELSGFLREPSYWLPPSSSPASGGQSASNWWPNQYGAPTSVGSQNEFGYALFSARKRLAIKRGGEVKVYDTLGYTIHGFSQQQGSGAPSLRLSTYQGDITLDALQEVSE